MTTQLRPRVLFGAAYYHEYQPYDRLETDLDLMAAAHFTVIRVGESVWSTWEPEDGQFDLDWLQPVLDGASARGISVVLGTPTYAVPPWLARLYPEIAGEQRTGERLGWGGRQEVDYTHAAFRFYAERVIRKIAARYADHPAVIGFQVDNEPGLQLFYNHGVFQRFVDHLRHTYGSVENLNQTWGLVYWSHRLSSWADLWRPDGNVQPQYALAWRRFQAALTTEFIGWQAEIVREYAGLEQFVTTCIDYGRPAAEDDELAGRLDVTSGNAYYEMQEGFARPDHRSVSRTPVASGVWALHLKADRMYASRQEPFLVTETNASHILSPHSRPAYDGQWRQAAWALVSRGARMVEYWHWHTTHFGIESSWGGLLPHSGRPGRTYREIARLGTELETAGDLVADLTPDAEIAMLFSLPSHWLMQEQPPLLGADGQADLDSYAAFFEPFYRAAFDAGLPVRIIHQRQLVHPVDGVTPERAAQQYAVLVVPGLYVVDDVTLDWLRAYAEAGGHLVMGPRTAYADQEARPRTEVQPARLAEAAGVWYEEYSNLDEAVPISAPAGGPGWAGPLAGTRWLEGLHADGADVLATYDHPHFGQWAAVTTRGVGQGRITCVGTVPDPGLGRALMTWLRPARDEPRWHDLPNSVTTSSATASDGRRVHFVYNWSFASIEVQLPFAVKDVLGLDQFAAGTSLGLGPWDVRVLVQQ